jgi:hypothetical protein
MDSLSPARVWIALTVVYGLFFAWYTPLSGPLREDEIARYGEVLRRSGAPPDRVALFRRFMEADSGGDFVMFNAIDLRASPLPVEGLTRDATSQEVMARYTGPFMREAVKSAAHPVLYGFAASEALDLWGIEGARSWTNGAFVRYRSRRDLMEQIVTMAERGDDIHQYKVAAIAKTVAFPLDPWFHLGDPRLVLGLAVAVGGLGWHLLWTRRALRRLSRT